MSDYIFGEKGLTFCPVHSTDILSAEECRYAHQNLTPHFDFGVIDSSNSLPGCHVAFATPRNMVVYNMDPKGKNWLLNQYRICKADYFVGGHNTNSCPSGSAPISNAAACRAAGEALFGHNAMSERYGVQNTSDRPRGCYAFFMTSTKVLYNEHKTGTSRRYRFPICATAAAARKAFSAWQGYKKAFEVWKGLA